MRNRIPNSRLFQHWNREGTLPMCIWLLSGQVSTQVSISGTVTAATSGETLPAVNFLVNRGSISTVTDIDGQYSIQVPNAEGILLFSFIGFASQEVPVNGRTVIDVEMTEDMQGLDEVVVVGYGTQRKATLTGSIASTDGQKIKRAPVSSLSNSLSGLLPGLTTLNRSGAPGENVSEIYIRGRSTTGDSRPLVIVDGVPDETGAWQRINQNDIESISI